MSINNVVNNPDTVDNILSRSSSDSDLQGKIRTRSKIRRGAVLHATNSADLLFNPIISDRKNILLRNRGITDPKLKIREASLIFNESQKKSQSVPNVNDSKFDFDTISGDVDYEANVIKPVNVNSAIG